MNVCVRCGALLDEDDRFCRRCGLPAEKRLAAPAAPAAAVAVPVAQSGTAKNEALPYFIWSLILFFILNPIGTPLSVAAAVNAAMANDPDCRQRLEKLRTARLLCIAATCADAATLLFGLAVLILLQLLRISGLG